MTDTLHERVTEDAAGASVATGANGARVWPEAVKARLVQETFVSAAPLPLLTGDARDCRVEVPGHEFVDA